MKLRFAETEILKWANKYDCSQEELDLIQLRLEIQKVGYIDKKQLKKIGSSVIGVEATRCSIKKKNKNLTRE